MACGLLFRELRDLGYQAKEEAFALKKPSLLLLNTANKVFSFLGLSSVPVKTNYVRTTPQGFGNFIENHGEVLRGVETSEFAHDLSD